MRIAATGAEFRCDVDFLRNRMRQEFARIRAELLGQPSTPLEPVLCDVVPLAVAGRIPQSLNRLEFYGYDFDRASVQVMLMGPQGTVDVTDKLNSPTHYHMDLESVSIGVDTKNSSQRFILRWNNKEISSIGIIPRIPPVCRRRVWRTSDVGTMSYTPPIPHGDTEFDGQVLR